MLVVVAIGCQYDPYAHLYVVEEPDWAEVEGEYVLAFQNLSRHEIWSSNNAPRIRLMTGGRCEVNSFPVWRHTGASNWDLVDSSALACNWGKTNPGSVWNGESHLRTWGVTLNPHPAGERQAPDPARGIETILDDFLNHPGSPTLARDEGVLMLVFNYGDPDAGRVMLFKRETPNDAG
jgi:hypothetical protein